MMTSVKNNILVNASVQNSNENNHFAFERFCEFCKEGYSIEVHLKSKRMDNASFHITAIKANDEREEICLFLNQEILNLVMIYLESGKLGDTSRINPNDLESFNERRVEFKKELFQTEKGKGKDIMWSYIVLEKLASIYYKKGVIIFHPYPYRSNPVNNSDKKTTKKNICTLSESFTQKEEVITPDFDSNYSPTTAFVLIYFCRCQKGK